MSKERELREDNRNTYYIFIGAMVFSLIAGRVFPLTVLIILGCTHLYFYIIDKFNLKGVNFK